jgi:hypothetical protein
MVQQLDVTHLLRKMMFLEAAVGKLLAKHEIDALHMRRKPTVSQAKEGRRKHYFLELLKEYGDRGR